MQVLVVNLYMWGRPDREFHWETKVFAEFAGEGKLGTEHRALEWLLKEHPYLKDQVKTVDPSLTVSSLENAQTYTSSEYLDEQGMQLEDDDLQVDYDWVEAE